MSIELLLNLLLIVSIGVLAVFFGQLSMSIARYKLSQDELEKIKRLEDTPTVSLCIPARNETHALADCLSSAIASDYPKLEIIVLDDCSQDKTSQIIRSFAHDGVRFISGEAPSDGWLGKNNAYQTLSTEAKGEYLVFMSVDTRVAPESISELVSYMQLNKLSMTSVLPQRLDNLRTSVIFAPLRYFWQLVLPLKFNTPLATSLWAIRSENLVEVGSFSSYKDKVDVENVLASQFSSKDEYRFLVGSRLLKVTYAKHWTSQVETAIRLWYPSLNKSIFRATLVILGHFVLFVLPTLVLVQFVLTIGSQSGYIHISWLLALVASLLANYVYIVYFRQIKTAKTAADYLAFFISFFLVPILAVQEIVLIVASFVQYKRGHVNWKGRNVCYPVLKKY